MAILCLLVAATAAAQEQVLANWFDDPFVQVCAAVSDCPIPLGPYATEVERRAQAHHRAEKGTSCYLAGGCDRHSYYAYDKDIAQGVVRTLRHSPLAGDSSLWITVQGRVVFVEGCVQNPGAGSELERLVREVPDVQQAIAVVYVKGASLPPYRLVPARTRRQP